MNVDIFKAEPSIRYYFASAVPLMALVLGLWFFFKHSLASERQTPYQRGIYEDLFFKLATSYPMLWARTGPREGIKPQSRLDRLKWRLITLWNDPDKTIRKTPGDDTAYDDLGTVQRLKRFLTSRWTKELQSFEDVSSSTTILEAGISTDDNSIVEAKTNADAYGLDLQKVSSAPAATEDDNKLGVPYTAMSPIQPRMARYRRGSSPGKRPMSQGSSAADRNSGIMVEEEPEDWLKHYEPPPHRRATFY
ncbi:uncharacterized protein KY384_006007 [Bacidia gigantensis]|uniref:uncharacterized protein n=1 Tax=Bacidia gigantensis TaxID=2732470 RepID=UPI001D05492E|nr:uncharacterized protein KY384_006007 [Bacidia gigantensis]KAG8529371.1 hypothetical protein KY384_006007 [Bacidia gigantensis]